MPIVKTTEKLIQCDRLASFIGSEKELEELTYKAIDFAWCQVEPGNIQFKDIIQKQSLEITDLEDELRDSEMQRQSD